jgi:tRNA (cmo5U34)-methyltransferase
VPCFDELYGIAAGLIPFEANQPFEVLDLGAGTGVLSQFIAAKFPHTKILLADIAPEMLKLAQERFARAGREVDSRMRYLILDHGQDPIPGRFDAIVSGLSIHHLEHDEKRALFARIYAALPAGGIFINAEVILGETDEIEQRANQDWMAAAREAGASESDLAAAIERQRHDRCATLDAQMSWLRETGFRDVAAAYRNLIFAVYSGRK